MNTALYIIGNGFDLMHGMHTSYKDYERWLKNNMMFDVVLDFESVFGREDSILWSDFETALGKYDFEKAATWDVKDQYIVELQDIEGNETTVISPSYIETSLKTLVDRTFTSWVGSIELRKEPRMVIDKDAFFLSFNYTETLESVYNIPQDQVYHIHGCRHQSGEQIIVGHNKYVRPTLALLDGNDVRSNNERFHRINEMNALRKPVKKLIKKAQPFWSKLQNIERVETVGHSCNKVDFPYFKKVASICKNAQWIFRCHSDEDKVRVGKMAKILGITHFQIKQG